MKSSLLVIALLTGCAESGGEPEADLIDCNTLGLEVPAARGEMGGVWDAPRGRLVFFGGNEAVPIDCAPGSTAFIQDTWAYYPHCNAYAQIGGDGPRRRGRYAVGHDAQGQKLVLHGGRVRSGSEGDYTLLDDTWVLDLATDTWSKLDITGPGARYNHAGAFVGDRFVVFGGSTSPAATQFEPKRDTWALDLSTPAWTKVVASNKPEARLYHGAASDGTKLYVYAGGDEGAFFGDFFGDLWALDLTGGAWSKLNNGGNKAPPTRIWPTLTHDPVANRLLMFSGHDETELGNLNDLWSFDLSAESWTQLRQGDTYNAPALGTCDFPADFTVVDMASPERREAATATWADGKLMVFGGKADCGNLNDVWLWDPATEAWEESFRSTTGEVCLRTATNCTSMCP